MKEEVKRLTPTPDVLRELYLKSGNQCAFPGCNRLIISTEGTLVGQLCHIEAALEGGQRFNSTSNNEERRLSGNLMLMCYEHHKITDDVEQYSVERMREIKYLHEAKFSNIERLIGDEIVDLSKMDTPKYPDNIRRINIALQWNLSNDELLESKKGFNDLLDKLTKLTRETRQVLAIILQHSFVDGRDFFCRVGELDIHASAPFHILKNHISILDRHKFITDNDVDGHEVIQMLDIVGWPILQDIFAFVNITKDSLEDIIVNLNFKLFEDRS